MVLIDTSFQIDVKTGLFIHFPQNALRVPNVVTKTSQQFLHFYFKHNSYANIFFNFFFI